MMKLETRQEETGRARRPVPGRPRTFQDEDVFRVITQILLESGMDGLTLQGLAKRVGHSHQALGRRFSTREGLLHAYVGWLARVIEEDVEAHCAAAATPLEAARTLWIEPVSAQIVENSETARQGSWTRLSLQLRREPSLNAALNAIFTRAHDVILGLIVEAQRLGELRMADPAEIHEAVLVAAIGASMYWAMYPGEDLLAKLIRCRERALAPYLPG